MGPHGPLTTSCWRAVATHHTIETSAVILIGLSFLLSPYLLVGGAVFLLLFGVPNVPAFMRPLGASAPSWRCVHRTSKPYFWRDVNPSGLELPDVCVSDAWGLLLERTACSLLIPCLLPEHSETAPVLHVYAWLPPSSFSRVSSAWYRVCVASSRCRDGQTKCRRGSKGR